jgi:hypothetical protein
MNSHVYLHSGYYWSAGTQYGWPKEDPGVGIAVDKIKAALPNDRIYVKSKYDYISISAKLAVAETKKYKSIMTVGKTKIAVIPKSRFAKEGKSQEWRAEKELEQDQELKDRGQGTLL